MENEYDALKGIFDELVELIERALAIRKPNSGKWTNAETERSWRAWEQSARAAINKTTATK